MRNKVLISMLDKKRRSIYSSFLFSVILFSLFSCTTQKPQLKKFNYQLQLYNKYLVWQKFYDAEDMVTKELQKKYKKKWKDLRYTDIVVNKIEPDNDNKNIKVIITRKFYEVTNPVVHSEEVEQVWQYDNSTWKLIKEKILDTD